MNTFTCGQARQMDLVDYLATLGHFPKKISGSSYWYLSPLRQEKNPSFKVNRNRNVWYDHGVGVGGGLVEFGIRYFNCSVSEFFQQLGAGIPLRAEYEHTPRNKDQPLQILSLGKITSVPLLRYLAQRRISESIAADYCTEATFRMHSKEYNALAFKNDFGGFELRNPWFKGSSSPKGMTTIENHEKELAVFEGFFDLLSYQTIFQNQPRPPCNFLVLNSATFFEKSRQFMEQHQVVRLFLDRDKTGQNCTKKALSWSSKFKDESHLYEGYKDLNEWAQHIGKAHKNHIKIG